MPKTVWYSSVFQIYKKIGRIDKWYVIKKKLFKTEGEKCWICGIINTKLEAHEFWDYDDENHIQKLSAIHHLGSMCHKIKHIGLWGHTTRGSNMLSKIGLTIEDLITHFCSINKCSRQEFEAHKQYAFKIYRQRSQFQWTQDFGVYDLEGMLKHFIESGNKVRRSD